jgi:hypothetical protein
VRKVAKQIDATPRWICRQAAGNALGQVQSPRRASSIKIRSKAWHGAAAVAPHIIEGRFLCFVILRRHKNDNFEGSRGSTPFMALSALSPKGPKMRDAALSLIVREALIAAVRMVLANWPGNTGRVSNASTRVAMLGANEASSVLAKRDSLQQGAYTRCRPARLHQPKCGLLVQCVCVTEPAGPLPVCAEDIGKRKE